ncbi:uncharacterized protein HGUI_03689 [Hanseniaspora guilliermondii]|uniref:Uncharacterized protein n=1 Tax=Hanseniaspora guilliermondii TaxID=56406 RepID=A0A1L0B4N7_9ASCO|nr:uncharacterized protein HGUI_03689 [Hanseniaspora guilliermondii]
MNDIITVKNISYEHFNDDHFDLIISININNSINNNFIQGIISLNSKVLSIKESILFIGDIPNTSNNVFFCVLKHVPILYNYLNINNSNILNYTLNVKLLSTNSNSIDSPINISYDKSLRINLKHKKFKDFNIQKFNPIEYNDSFICYNSIEYISYIQCNNQKHLDKSHIKQKITDIINNKPPIITENENFNYLNEKNNTTFNIKTNKQIITISLNKSSYPLESNLDNIFISIHFEKFNRVSAISAQVFKYYNLQNFQGKVKVSPKVDKFTLFNDQMLNLSIPLFKDEVTEPSVPDILKYYLLIKFVEPELNSNPPEDQYFDNIDHKNILSKGLKPDADGTLGLCQIPLSITYF